MGGLPARVLGVGTALPGGAVDTAALAGRFGMNQVWQQWVDAFIGTRTRHLAIDLATGEQRYSLADLAETAARQAIEDADVSVEDIDVVVFGTATPDDLMPATVNVVADRLRIDGIPTFQLQSGCSGAVQTFDVATALLSTGRYRTALVIGGDVIAKHYDVTADLTGVPPEELVNYVLFGDGAGAAVLSTEEREGAPVVRSVLTRLSGLDRQPGQVLRWFGIVDRDGAAVPASEDYRAIAESVPVLAREVADELLDDLGWARDEVDFLLPPQLSATMTAKITEALGFPAAKEVSRVADIGNNGNALLFFQLRDLVPAMSAPSRAIAVAIESSKWIKSGIALEAA
ncbi:3-oxoacyl-ACP synthase III family protein [Actinokineospora auranticolor]|uniref:3-oxoacyl-[acyl-carrier-protein] synthase-3 n=1 Tax=Actinokineospora auranticolor TaxID=155976 RepID=A0A2S6H1R8_9PSEU|nr:3-oxoacyl-ACP synthase III family protein [Actinokineospora auranticolor]PPK71404.1 3-oxoacyl-[acyl-carrier-protein] synthase-3 [Actinokineospora auranticolor]